MGLQEGAGLPEIFAAVPWSLCDFLDKRILQGYNLE
jgi:hypothetical protein